MKQRCLRLLSNMKDKLTRKNNLLLTGKLKNDYHGQLLQDIKCSGNWMWPAKLPGEGAALLEACSAMCDVMKSLGIAVDGGKDSLSMAARVGETTVKSPGMYWCILDG